ncbi:RHS repeat-associated core domain-containing protein [Actinoplanes sp. CA-131856]
MGVTTLRDDARVGGAVTCDCASSDRPCFPELRVARTAAGTTTNMVWAASGTMPLLLDHGTHRYLYGPGLTPYAQVGHDGTIEYLHTDAIGSVRAITNAAGTTVATNTYDAYGNRTAHAGITGSAIGYTGNWTDPTTGLVYLRARDYDTITGQFLTIDPKSTAPSSPTPTPQITRCNSPTPPGSALTATSSRNWRCSDHRKRP